MARDLIARLRDMGIECCNLAADRIAALETQLLATCQREAESQKRHDDKVAALEAQLADRPALGAERMRQEAVATAEQWNQHYRCAGGFHNHAVAAKVVRDEIDAIPAPTHEQMLADALALEEVRAVVEACRDVIAEREIDGQGDCGCDMCMAVDRMTITIAKLKGVEE